MSSWSELLLRDREWDLRAYEVMAVATYHAAPLVEPRYVGRPLSCCFLIMLLPFSLLPVLTSLQSSFPRKSKSNKHEFVVGCCLSLEPVLPHRLVLEAPNPELWPYEVCIVRKLKGRILVCNRHRIIPPSLNESVRPRILCLFAHVSSWLATVSGLHDLCLPNLIHSANAFPGCRRWNPVQHHQPGSGSVQML